MKMYYIDASNLSESDRREIDRQIEFYGYLYSPVLYLREFTFYAEENEHVKNFLQLPDGCVLKEFG